MLMSPASTAWSTTMAKPEHRLRPPKNPRIALIVVPRSVFLAVAWSAAGNLLDDLHHWTGWWIFVPFGATARTMALGYLVIALLQWSRHARR